MRDQHSARRERPLLPYDKALANRLKIDWAAAPLTTPAFSGRRVLSDVPLAELVPYIDWTFFFAAWELKGRFPAILDHPQYGSAARALYDAARTLLDRIVAEKRLRASAVYGFWPAVSEGDDIVVYRDGASDELMRFNMLRQQEPIADGKPNLSLADFIAPDDPGGRSSRPTRSSRRLRRHGGPRRRDVRARSRPPTTTTRDYGESARRSPGGSVCGVSAREGARGLRHEEHLSPEQILVEAHRGIRPDLATRRVPITARNSSCSVCSMPPPSASHDRARGDAAGGERQRPVLRASSGAIFYGRENRRRSSGVMPCRKGRPVEEIERWLSEPLPTSRPAAKKGKYGPEIPVPWFFPR